MRIFNISGVLLVIISTNLLAFDDKKDDNTYSNSSKYFSISIPKDKVDNWEIITDSDKIGKANDVVIKNKKRSGYLGIYVQPYDLSKYNLGDLGKLAENIENDFKGKYDNVKVKSKKEIVHKGTKEKAIELIMNGVDKKSAGSIYHRYVILKSESVNFTYILGLTSLAEPEKDYKNEIDYIIGSFKAKK